MPDESHVDDPLNVLFVDRQPLDRALLARVIQPYIRLYGDTAEVVTTNEWEKLNLQLKILTFMLGRKALHIKGLISDEEVKISSSQLEQWTGLKPNSIRPTLSKLVDDRLLRHDKEKSAYSVPDHVLPQIEMLLTGGKK